MINLEKIYETMNPTKALEALNLAKVYDVKAQSKALKKSTDLVFELAELYQTQTRKVVEFYMGQNETAVKEGQKLLNEWIAAATKAGSELVGEVENNIKEATKEAAKVFEAPKATKVAKAA